MIRSTDPARAVAEPVEHALGALIAGAGVSFALSVVTVLFAVLSPDGPLHEVAHFGLLGVMGTVVAARVVHVLRRRRHVDPRAWIRAREVHRSDARLAQWLTYAVPLAWLVGSVTILVHHLPDLGGAVFMAGAWLPVAAGLWVSAAFAWHDFCHDRLAGALDQSDRRYRKYWRDIARTS